MRDCYYSKYEPIFGSWHITEEIGAGAEGHLYRIRREDALGHVFYSALKAITIPGNGEAELASLIAGGMSREEAEHYYDSIAESTVGEFELLEKLKGNSNIVSYEDHEIFRREEGFGWDVLIRMEELTPLVSHSVYHQMDEKEVIRLGMDICRGLTVCSRFGIVHRDIKPENIFISPAGSYKLGDFGIARILENSDTSLSRKGTFSYMAPEIYWGRDYDFTVDVYSLGMVMYRYMNDGRLPFMPVYPDPVGYTDGETAFASRIGGKALPEPRNGSPELKQIILKACAYDKADRYGSAEEMLRDLEALENGTLKAAAVTSEKRTGSAEGAGKGRKPFMAAALALILIATVIATYVSIPKEVEDITCEGIEGGAEILIGDDLEAEYTPQPEYWYKDEPVTFSSADEKVFTVDEEGRLHGSSVGESVLTICSKGYTEEIPVSVLPKVTSIEGIDKTMSLTTGGTLQLKPSLKPEKYADEKIKYSTSDEKIAKVSDSGEITAVSAGETRLKVSAGGCSAEYTVNVSDPVVYRASTSSSSKKSSKKKSSGSVKGYFSSSDDEHF